MTNREFYGPYYERMKMMQAQVLSFSYKLMKYYEALPGSPRIVSVHSRIKTPESMLEK